MRTTLATPAACLLVLLVTCGPAVAQQPPPSPADPAAALRTREVLSDQDKAQLRQWMDGRLQALAEASRTLDGLAKTGDEAARGAAAKALQTARKQVVEPLGQGPTPAYRTSYAETAMATFPPYMGVGNDPRGRDPRVALYLIQILGSLKQTASLDVLLATLSSRHPAVRYWAPRAIRDMRGEIKGNLVDRTMAELAKAGAKEGYPPAAQMMYEAVDFRTQVGGSAPRVIAAWLQILSGRLQFYGNDLVDEFYPDAGVLGQLAASPDLTDADKKRAAQIALAIIDQCVQRWVAVARPEEGTPVEPENPYNPYSVRDWHLRYQLTAVTEQAEALLRKVGPVAGTGAPDVAKAMRDISTADQVRLAFEKWQTVVPPGQTTAAAPATQGVQP